MDEERAAEEKIVRDVAEFGWHCVMVEAGDGCPEFAYTIGLGPTYAHPELVLFGLPQKTSHGIMWDAVRLIQQRTMLEDGKAYENILDGYVCAARAVHQSVFPNYIGFAMWYYRVHVGDPFALKAIQLVWPDFQGRFPWDKGFDEEIVTRQPRLYFDK